MISQRALAVALAIIDSGITFQDARTQAKNKMDVIRVNQRGNTLQAEFKVTNNYNTDAPFSTILSPEYIISGWAKFQVQVKVFTAKVYKFTVRYSNIISIKFVKLREDDDVTYAIKFSSKLLGIDNKNFITDDGTWHFICDIKEKQFFSFDITVNMDIIVFTSNPFATLHEDIELLDFELRGEDGSVHMHRAVLAASSPVLGQMLGSSWKEAAKGHVDVPGTSKATLQHLKNYVYLHTLPEVGLEQLLVLASYYMITYLEQGCVDKLVSNLAAKNALDLLDFAVKHKITRLLLSILECVQDGAVKVDDMRGYILDGK